VKVSITRGGGVAGILRVVSVDAADVPFDVAAMLRAPSPSPPSSRPDEMTYAVRVGDDEARFTDSTLPPEVRELIAWADAHPERREQIRPPG
jgi:hypothetical protein